MMTLAHASKHKKTLALLLILLLPVVLWVGVKSYRSVKARLAPYYHAYVQPQPTPPPKLEEPVILLGQGTQSVFSLLDMVGLHHKNGLSEVYGAAIRFRQSGPLKVRFTELHISHDTALLAWKPDHSPAAGATHLAIQFEDKIPAHGSLEVFLQTRSGTTYLFKRPLGVAAPPVHPKPLPALVPDELSTLAAKASVVDLRRGGKLQFVAELPQALKEELATDAAGQAITGLGLMLHQVGKATVQLKQVSLVKDDQKPLPNTISVGGSVTGVALEPGSEITLLLEDGTTRKQQLSTDARFKFDELPRDTLFSLRLPHHGRNHYSVLGRWAAATLDRDDVHVATKPLFQNPEGKAPDASKSKFVTPREPTKVAAIYESHARQLWPGGGTPQEYDSITVTNNHGFIDRDRFFDNPDQCVRFVHLGSSHAVALQVRPFEKYNIEMESELAVKLQKCVEVLSAGRDNGDIGSNYPRIRDYAVRFKPDAILLENSNSLTMQLHPTLLRLGFGWDHEHNALDNFFYQQGKLAFREWSADYGLHATKPDYKPLQNGIPLMRTLQVPREHMHPYGIEAFQYLADIMQFLRTTHPDQRFIIHTGLDQAQCRGQCMSKLPGKAAGEVGAKTFVSNHRAMCHQAGLECIDPAYPHQHETKETQLTYLFDGHYRLQGHQWLARELADGWITLNGKAPSQAPASVPVTAAPVPATAAKPAGQLQHPGKQGTTAQNQGAAQSQPSWRPAQIRVLPFPFKHLVTVASDVDMQTPENGAAIHRLMNEQFGLPIADSIWVQGDSAKASSLFQGGLQLNRSPVDGTQHKVYGHILREWHKGNADSFHSWQDDSVPQLTQAFQPAIRLSGPVTQIDLKEVPANLGALNYRNLRLHFSGACPANLALRLHDTQGRTLVVSSDQVRQGQQVMASSSSDTCVTDLLFGGPNPLGVDCDRSCFNLALLKSIDLIAPDCATSCKLALVRISRDNFSRLTVKSQLPRVQAFNLRPAFLSSHGGFTMAQNFGWDDDQLVFPRSPGSMFESKVVQNVVAPGAAQQKGHAYHADLLQELGVNSIWSYFFGRGEKSRRIMGRVWTSNLDSPSSTFSGFHDVQRTYVSFQPWPTESFDHFSSWFKQNRLRMPADFLKDVFCTNQCGSDQGSMLGVLLELSISQAKLGKSVENIWYTHLGSGNPDFKRSDSEPLPSTATSRLGLLADHYYGMTPAGQAERIWVPPAGVAINYRNMREQVRPQVRVRPGTSEVRITSWRDPVTGKLLANGPSALQELQGLTVYVPDAGVARVHINGSETRFFTRNGPDQTGQPSITLVDDTAPQMMIDQVPLRSSGRLSAVKGTVEDIKHQGTSTDFVRVAGPQGAVLAEWQPHQAKLANITHLSLEYRKQAPPEARFFVEIEMVSGGKMVVLEQGIESHFPSASHWKTAPTASSETWTTVVVPLTQLQWPTNSDKMRAPLPLGQVKAVRFGLMGTTQAASADIRTLAGLRPSSNAAAPDGAKLVGGQVLGIHGKPEQGQVVRLRRADGSQLETVTDVDGYYYFYRQPAGALASLTAGKQRCAPIRASQFIIRQDDPEWDFDFRHCKQG